MAVPGPPGQLLKDALAGRFAPPAAYGPRCYRDFDSTLGFPGEGPWTSSSDLSPCPERSVLPCLICLEAFLFGLTCTSLHFWTLTWIRLLSLTWTSGLFDATLGFPGEGWVFLLLFFRVWIGFAMDAPAPRTPADTARADRRSELYLVPDRVVRQATPSNRARLLKEFDCWLRTELSTTFEMLIALGFEESETISLTLVRYGQHLFRNGAAYNRYSETINAVSSLRPGIRRSLNLGAAWDLALAWLAEEPHVHHRALPRGVLLALLTAALIWGWLPEAAIFAMCWTGFLKFARHWRPLAPTSYSLPVGMLPQARHFCCFKSGIQKTEAELPVIRQLASTSPTSYN